LAAQAAGFVRMMDPYIEELAIIWSSEYGFTVDALELYGEEGRDKLRKAAVRSTYPVTRR
jgi:hypothetical protein